MSGVGRLCRGLFRLLLPLVSSGTIVLASPVLQNANPIGVKYRLQVQLGHPSDIRQVAYLPDGRTLVSSGDSTIRRWDLRTGRLMDVLGGFGAPGHFAVSTDGRRLAVIGEDRGSRTLLVASLSDLRDVQRIPLTAATFREGQPPGQRADQGEAWDIIESVDVVAFHPGDSNQVTLSARGGLVLFDYAHRRVSSTIRIPSAGLYSASLDGSRVASVSNDEIRVWDVARRSCLVVLTSPGGAIGEIALADDGRALAAHLVGDRAVYRWTIPGGTRLPPIMLYGSPLRTPIALSPDNSKLAVADGTTVLVYEWQTMARVLALNPWDGFVDASFSLGALQFSKDGAKVAYGASRPYSGEDNSRTLGIIDLAGQRVERPLNGISWEVAHFDVAERARKVISGSYGVQPARPIWDLNALSLDGMALRPPESRVVSAVAIDADATKAFSSGYVWGLSPPKVLLPDSVVFGKAMPFATKDAKFLDGGRNLFLVNGQSGLDLIDVVAAKRTWGPGNGPANGNFTNAWSAVAFSPDDRLAVVGHDVLMVGGLRVAHLQVPLEAGPFTSAAIVDSNRKVAVLGTGRAGDPDYLATYSAADGTLDKMKNLPEGSYYISAAFDPRGARAWLGSRDGRVQEWDTERMTPGREWSVASSDVKNLRFLPDMNCLAMSSEAPVITFLRLDSGHELSLLSVDDEWIVYTEDGYFDASPGAAPFLNVVSGASVYGIDQFTAQLNRPDIILERFGLGTPAQIAYFRRQHETRLRRLGLEESSGGFIPHVPTVQVTAASVEGSRARVAFSMRDEAVAVRAYQMFVNGVPVFDGGGKDAKGQATATEVIELSAGLNRIEVSCMNAAGAESYREMVQLGLDQPASPQLFFLGFGVSKYANASLNLGFADKDAQDLAAMFARMGTSFSKINVRSFVNEDASRTTFRAASEWLAGAGVNDTVVLFLAGHGVHDRDQDATYYFLTHEADASRLPDTSVSYETIEALMAGVRARHKLVLLDTCESGELEESAIRTYTSQANSRGLRARSPRSPDQGGGDQQRTAATRTTRPYLLDRNRLIFMDLARRTGAVVFSASRGNELSYESETYKNGYFTAGLLRALSGTNQAAGGVTVTTAGLRQAVKTWVERETGDLQHPTIDRDNLYQSMTFPVVKTPR